MATADDFSSYVSELLLGAFNPGSEPTEEQLRQMAADFSRRVRAFGQKHHIPIQFCEKGDKTKHARAEKLRPKDPNFCGVF